MRPCPWAPRPQIRKYLGLFAKVHDRSLTVVRSTTSGAALLSCLPMKLQYNVPNCRNVCILHATPCLVASAFRKKSAHALHILGNGRWAHNIRFRDAPLCRVPSSARCPGLHGGELIEADDWRL